MTDEELREHTRLLRYKAAHYELISPDFAVELADDLAEARAEVERLRGENADMAHRILQQDAQISEDQDERDALLAVVRAVAELGVLKPNGYSYLVGDFSEYCPWCSAARGSIRFDEDHADDCPVTHAHALVAAHDAATGASATGQQVVLRGSISDECKRGEHAKCKGWTDKGACVCGCGHTKPL